MVHDFSWYVIEELGFTSRACMQVVGVSITGLAFAAVAVRYLGLRARRCDRR